MKLVNIPWSSQYHPHITWLKHAETSHGQRKKKPEDMVFRLRTAKLWAWRCTTGQGCFFSEAQLPGAGQFF